MATRQPTVIRGVATRFLSEERAIAIAERCQAGDPDWTYKVEVMAGYEMLAQPYYLVACYDEDGQRVGAL